MNSILARFWQPVAGTIIFIVIFWGYFQAEILTSWHKDEFQSICQDTKTDVSGISLNNIFQVKVLEYNKNKGDAKIYCIYPKSDQNTRFYLNYYDQKWQVITKKIINVDGEVYWPIYLFVGNDTLKD